MAKPIPDDHPGASAAIDFYCSVWGARERMRTIIGVPPMARGPLTFMSGHRPVRTSSLPWQRGPRTS